MLKSLFSSIGISGTTVDTVVDNNQVVVGETLIGRVDIKGGSTDQVVQGVALELFTRCLIETRGDQKVHADIVVASGRIDLDGIRAGERKSVPVAIPIDPATPLSLGTTSTRLRTRLDIANAVDARDNDLVRILPNRVMSAIFNGLETAGFRLVETEIEYNPRRKQPFVQEFDFKPRSLKDFGVEEVEISFKPLRNGIEVALTVDRRGGLFTAGGERTSRFKVKESDLSHLNMANELRNAITMLR
jgi:sporulation-control protein